MRFREIIETDKKEKPKVTQAQIHAWAADASEKYGVPIQMVMHVLNKETGGAANPAYATGAISNKGAGGVMQIMPGTAKDNNVKNVFDPKENVYAGVKILARHYNNFDQNPVTALAAYNSGGGTVNSYLTGTPLKVTQPDGTIKTINPKGIKTTDGVPPYEETQKYVYGKDDGKGNMVGGYNPNTAYDVAALKAALPTSKTDTVPVSKPDPAPIAKPDPAAVGQANVDKMAAWDRSKNAPVTPPSQSQARAADNKIDAATPNPAPTPVTNPDQIVDQPRDFRPAAPGSVPNALKTPNQIGNQPGGSTPSAPIIKAEPAPTPVVAPAPSPTPIAKTIPAPVSVTAPAVDTTGGAGKTGPTIAASKGLDSSNQLNKGPVILPTPAPAPAPTGDWKALAKANKITDPNIITPGQELKLPGDIKYTVSKGDTLSGIASGNYKGTAPITPAPAPPPEITTDRLKALSGNATSLPSTLGPSPTIDLLNKGVNGKTSSADLVPDIKTAAADTDADDLEKMAVAENSKTINTRRYSFLLGL